MTKIVNVDLENCYGIKKLQAKFDFTNYHSFAIYAPNGAMKTSFAQTFQDVANSTETKDRVFPNRVCRRKITDEEGIELSRECVHVICPYDETYSHTEKTSTLLVNSILRKEYEELYIEIDKSKEILLNELKEQSGSKKNLEIEISSIFTKRDDGFFQALLNIKDEILNQKDAPFADIPYDKIFDEKVLRFLATKDVNDAIENYIKKYNELLAASVYFKKGMFNYYNASTIAKNLADNGFFDAKHTVNLIGDKKLEITSQKQFEELIVKEKEGISNDKELRKKYAEIEKLITKNANLRDFENYILEHEELLPKLVNVEGFKEEVWRSYFKAKFDLFKDLVDKYQTAEKRKLEIEEEARKQQTQWEYVIEIFNSRFFVPFKLVAKNRVPVILGQEPILTLEFIFEDGEERAPVEKNALLHILSTGEKKALYILNIIFEVEARKKANQETIFIIDDLADSFDYKNKYAIIQYLQEINEEPNFYQIILTHNFDFFRTINSRFINYSQCLMAIKNDNEIALKIAVGIRNIFVNDWKPNFFTEPKKKIASIPFIRNIIEYTKGNKDPDFAILTSLLHWKNDTSSISESELERIYNSVFCTNGTSGNGKKPMIDIIFQEADKCLTDGDSVNFENKIVLSIAIRIVAEQFMVNSINDSVFLNSIDSNQTPKLLAKFTELFGGETVKIETIKRVILMTPENIHLNSFMYEPIMDMSDEHLKRLYQDVRALT